jgi:drug/metabolite transporter (DMT)-like permease
MNQQYRLGLVLVTASAVAWSTAGLFTRLIHLDSWTMLAWRGIFGALGIALVIFAFERRKAWRSFIHLGLPGWAFAIVSAIGMICFITALRQTSVAHVAVIYALAPFIAAALGWLAMRELPTRNAVATSAIALAGVAVMVGFGTDGTFLGDILALGMTICCAAMMVIARRFPEIPTMSAAFWSALLSGLVCWPMGEPLSLSSSSLALLVLFGVVNSAIGLILFTLGARFIPPIETALIGSLDAPLAPLWVWIAFDEAPSAATVVGGAIVFAAVGIHVWYTTQQSPGHDASKAGSCDNPQASSIR